MWLAEASSFFESTDKAFYFTIWVSVFFMIAITAFMIFSVVRYYHKRHKEPSTNEGSVALEIIWTVVPTILVVIMFYYGYKAYMDYRNIPDDAMKVTVQSGKWYWKFQYENGVERYDKEGLKVPLGKPVQIELVSNDVIHSFFIPAFRVKLDAVPMPAGRENNKLWFKATKEGEFELFCAEYCGLDHSRMLSKVEVVSPEEFDTWYAQAGQEVAQQVDKGPGEELYQSKGCFACHSLDGSKKVGPSFKGLWQKSETVVSGGTERSIVVDEAYLKTSMKQPGADIVKGYPPAMPPQNLNDKEIQQLIDFIKTIK